MHRGFSLPELVLVLAVSSILMGIAIPRIIGVLDSIEVENAAAHIVAAHRRARLAATTRAQVLTLSIASDTVALYPRNGSTPLWSEAGPASFGVSLSGPARRFTFSPAGFTLGLSNATLQLARGASRRSIVISRLGRIRILRE